MTVWTSEPTTFTPLLGYEQDPFSLTGLTPVFGPPIPVDGFRLIDSRASYGVGLETFALGFPIHFDWSWRTLFNKDWEDLVYAYPASAEGSAGAATGSARSSSRCGSATTSSRRLRRARPHASLTRGRTIAIL